MSSPVPWILGGPDHSKVGVPPFLSSIPPPLGPLLTTAWGLFGSPHGLFPAPPGGGSPEHGPPPLPQHGTFLGQTAEAEAAAKVALTGQTKALKDLDQQLDELSKKITDQNNAARQKLLDIKKDIDRELDYVNTSHDDDIQKSAALSQFMSDKAAAIAKVITDAAATVGPNQHQLQQLQNQYGQGPDPDAPSLGSPSSAGDPGGPADPAAAPGDTVPSSYAPSGGGPYGGGGAGYGDDPGSALGQMLPLMGSALPGALGGLNPMSSLGGLGDLGSVLGEAVHNRSGHHGDDDDPKGSPDKKDKPGEGGSSKVEQAGLQKNDQAGQTGGQGPQPPSGATPTPTAPSAPPAPSLVKRPDGSSATAVSPAVASAASAHLGGASVEDAYKAAGITLAPPGTPVKDTLPSLSVAQVGDLAVFKDKYVMLLGDSKVYLDGQEQPVSALAKLTGFLGFCHPPASSTPSVAAPSAPAAGQPVPLPSTPV